MENEVISRDILIATDPDKTEQLIYIDSAEHFHIVLDIISVNTDISIVNKNF